MLSQDQQIHDIFPNETFTFKVTRNGVLKNEKATFRFSSNRIECTTDLKLSLRIPFIVGVKKLENELKPEAKETEAEGKTGNEQGLRIISYLVKETKSRTNTFKGSKPSKAKFVRETVELTLVDQSETNEMDETDLTIFYTALKWLISHCKQELPRKELDTVLENKKSLRRLLPELPPQRKLLFYVNPHAGTGKAMSIVEHFVRPIIEGDAEASLKIVVTENQGHAMEHVRTFRGLPEKYDGIVIVSGDGLLHEVIQGIMQRPDWKKVVTKLSFGVLPAGTGNGLATHCLKAVDERLDAKDLINSCVLVAQTGVAPMDLLAVDLIYQKENSKPKTAASAKVDDVTEEIKQEIETTRMYSFLSLEWGAVAYLDIASEWARCLGSARFTLWGLLSVLKKVKYRGVLSFAPAVSDAAVAETIRTAKNESVPKVPSYWAKEASNESSEVVLELMPDPTKAVPENWISIESDKFLTMWNTNIAWMAVDGCPSGDSQLNDGYMQLSYVDTGRFDLLNYLLSLSEGNTIDLAYLKAFTTRCFRLEIRDSHTGKAKRGTFNRFLCVDGEKVDYTSIQFENLCSFLKLQR